MRSYRWVTSHKQASERVFQNYPIMMKHMTKVIRNERYFGAPAVEKAQEIKDFFMSATTLLLTVFNLDVMQIFSKVSLAYQSKDATIAGQAYSKEDLFEGVDSMTDSGGPTTAKFLTVSNKESVNKICKYIQYMYRVSQQVLDEKLK